MVLRFTRFLMRRHFATDLSPATCSNHNEYPCFPLLDILHVSVYLLSGICTGHCNRLAFVSLSFMAVSVFESVFFTCKIVSGPVLVPVSVIVFLIVAVPVNMLVSVCV